MTADKKKSSEWDDHKGMTKILWKQKCHCNTNHDTIAEGSASNSSGDLRWLLRSSRDRRTQSEYNEVATDVG